jgi:hypothetical protein
MYPEAEAGHMDVTLERRDSFSKLEPRTETVSIPTSVNKQECRDPRRFKVPLEVIFRVFFD